MPAVYGTTDRRIRQLRLCRSRRTGPHIRWLRSCLSQSQWHSCVAFCLLGLDAFPERSGVTDICHNKALLLLPLNRHQRKGWKKQALSGHWQFYLYAGILWVQHYVLVAESKGTDLCPFILRHLWLPKKLFRMLLVLLQGRQPVPEI